MEGPRATSPSTRSTQWVGMPLPSPGSRPPSLQAASTDRLTFLNPNENASAPSGTFWES